MDHHKEYDGHKSNYLLLRQMDNIYQLGGTKNIIIHVAGSSGAGKTTLGLKLKNIYKDKIILKDLDDLRDDFIKYHSDKNTSLKEFK
jgi:pantothenate kinase-related protein Tda10